MGGKFGGILVQCIQHGTRIFLDDMQEHGSRSARNALALLPVAQGGERDLERRREFLLRHAGLFPDPRHVEGVECMDAITLARALLIGQGFFHALDKGVTHLAHCHSPLMALASAEK